SCCFSTAQESDSRSNVSLATQVFQQPARAAVVRAAVRCSPRSWWAAPPSLLFPPRGPPAQTFRGDVEQRNDKDPEERSGEHAAEHRRAHRMAGDGAGALGDNQRKETEDEREAGHHHRAKPQAGRFDGGGANVLAELTLFHRERHDQN